MHWCMDETLAVLAMLPFIGYFFRKLHAWYHAKMGHTCHEKHCDDQHVEHPYSPYDRANWHKDQHVSEEDMKYLRGTPAPLKITIPVVIERDNSDPNPIWPSWDKVLQRPEHSWDPISQEDVEERFGKELVKDLYDNLRDLSGMNYVTASEISWFVNDKAEVKTKVRGRILVHDYECCEHGWRIG